MRQAIAGDFLVTVQNSNYTLFLISSADEQRLVVEEISIPEKAWKSKKYTWASWVAKGAPGHTSWVCYDIDLATGQLSDYYSFSRKGWLQVTDMDQFLTTLLKVKFHDITSEKRRKKGHAPSRGAHDHRPIWHPPLVFEGKQIADVSFRAWEATWPKDGSDLAGSTITVYLPETAGTFPTYFPYWIEVSQKIGSGKLRIIDAGKQLSSPKQRPLRFSTFHE
jgi:hypothetical protein